MQYNEITPYYQDLTPVSNSLSLNKPSPGKDHSNKEPEKPYGKVFISSQNHTDKNISAILNPSRSSGDDELQSSDFAQYNQYFKPVFPVPSRCDETLPEENIYRELESPERQDLTPPASVKNKQVSVPFNSLK